MKTTSFLTTLAAMASLSTVITAAPLGTAFTYQGKLSSGANAANGSYDLKFSLYDALTSGSQVGNSLTNTATAVSNGYFTVTLDFGALFDGNGRWLEIAVRTNGSGAFTTLSPRQCLTPSPYALYAPNAGAALTAVAATAATIAHSVADGSINNAAIAVGAVNSASIADGTIVSDDISSIDAGKILGGDLQASRLKVGTGHTLSGAWATIAGGWGSTATGPGSVVGGGGFDGLTYGGNVASGGSSTIGGGLGNSASEDSATVGGGAYNLASGLRATVGGGLVNKATDYGATVAGGHVNTATNSYATVSGGYWNTANGGGTAVGGGAYNTANGVYAVVSGGYSNQATGPGAFVGGGGWNGSFASGNTAGGAASTVGGGFGNVASGPGAFVGGGGYDGVNQQPNIASGRGSVIGGGFSNNVTAAFAAIPGGAWNWAAGYASAIAGGQDNATTMPFSSVVGGQENQATNWWATVGGGFRNVAGGQYSFAAGFNAIAQRDGAFVWADSTGLTFDPWALAGPQGVPNSFNIRSTGGFYIVTGIDGSGNILNGVTLTSGSGTWGSYSDRNAKTNCVPVDPRAVLDKVAALPIAAWNYKTQDPAIRHIGPMAQDFYAAFRVGDSDKTITTVDADGVTLAAIQGLNQKLEEALEAKDSQIRALEESVAQLKALLNSTSQKSDEGGH